MDLTWSGKLWSRFVWLRIDINGGLLWTLRITGFSEFCPSSGILETRKHNVSETGSVSVLSWGGETPTLLGLVERANHNHWGRNRVGVSPPHLRTETSSFRNVVFSSFLNTGWWTRSENLVILSIIHHRQNPVESFCEHVLNLRVPWKLGNILTSWETINIYTRNVVHATYFDVIPLCQQRTFQSIVSITSTISKIISNFVKHAYE
jgi:hypothetical protein